ncbi:MAG: GNAT family N-acetyltransferase [Ignavibacteriales bacterium]|nr:MAG: GNAT family N-acetyltransferase [Ignavibacteriales bacterium]
MNEKLKDIISILKGDLIRNVNLINFIEDNEILETHIVGNAIMVKGISDRTWIYFSCREETELNKLIVLLKPEDANFAILEDWMIPILKGKLELNVELTTIKYILRPDVVIPGNKIQVEELFPDDATFIYMNYDYREFTNISYIKERIIKGISAGIRIHDKLAGWAITHDDGAIGMLHVLPEFRRQGLAKEITINMIEKLRALGKLPFAQIEEKNFKSIRLVENLGFVKDRRVSWASKIF